MRKRINLEEKTSHLSFDEIGLVCLRNEMFFTDFTWEDKQKQHSLSDVAPHFPQGANFTFPLFFPNSIYIDPTLATFFTCHITVSNKSALLPCVQNFRTCRYISIQNSNKILSEKGAQWAQIKEFTEVTSQNANLVLKKF